MLRYSESSFENLINLLVETYGYSFRKIHEYVIEVIASRIPIFRLIYSPTAGDISVSFNVATPSVEAIQLFAFITKHYKLVQLNEVYFYCKDGTFVGQDAYVEYELYLEEYFNSQQQINDNEDAIVNYKPEYPVTLIISDPLYEASHPMAKEADIDFKNRKKIKW